MEREFFNVGDTKLLKIISSSPEEAQCEDGPLPDHSEWPVGTYIDVVKRVENGRLVRYVGLANVGERLTLPGDGAKPSKQAPPKELTVPPVLQKQANESNEQHDARLETLAARNNIEVNPKWRQRSRQARMADVATAMQNTRKMPEMVGGQLVK